MSLNHVRETMSKVKTRKKIFSDGLLDDQRKAALPENKIGMTFKSKCVIKPFSELSESSLN